MGHKLTIVKPFGNLFSTKFWGVFWRFLTKILKGLDRSTKMGRPFRGHLSSLLLIIDMIIGGTSIIRMIPRSGPNSITALLPKQPLQRLRYQRLLVPLLFLSQLKGKACSHFVVRRTNTTKFITFEGKVQGKLTIDSQVIDYIFSIGILERCLTHPS